jgi:hypothetical protein
MSSHIAIEMTAPRYQMQLQSKPESFFKAVATLFQASLNDSYFEKWRQAQEEIAVLRREIYALKKSSLRVKTAMRVQFDNGATTPTLRPSLEDSPRAFPLDSPV